MIGFLSRLAQLPVRAPNNRKVAKRPSRSRPVLEALERRWLPSCMVGSFSPGIVDVVGDARVNKVQIQDNGAGAVSIVADGVGYSFSDISQIRVKTLGGEDFVSYNLTDLLWGKRLVQADLGDDNDSFQATLSSHVVAFANLQLNVSGGAGHDTLRVDALGDIVVRPGAHLGMNLYGQAGRDSIFVNYKGELDGAIDLLADGGDDWDSIAADFTLNTGSTGKLFARVQGGAADDTLQLTVRKRAPNDPVVIDALIDGGLGFDRCTRTANVGQINCEADTVVP